MEVFQVTKEKTYFPAESWQHSTPEEQGMDSNLLTKYSLIVCYIDKCD